MYNRYIFIQAYLSWLNYWIPEGKLWALMSSKDKAGRIYIRAYRNRWDSVKKRSFVESKVTKSAGCSTTVPSGFQRTFVDKFPQYAHQTVFGAIMN